MKKLVSLVLSLVLVLSLSVPALALDFSDITQEDWYYKAVTDIVDRA